MKKLLILMFLSLILVSCYEEDPCDVCGYDEKCVIVEPEDQDPFNALFGEDEVKCIHMGFECEGNYDCEFYEICNENGFCEEKQNNCDDIKCQDGYRCEESTGMCIKKNVCDGVTCGGYGVCIEEGTFEARCICDEGYRELGLTCVKDSCVADSDCDNNEVCNLFNNSCEPSSCREISCLEGEECVVDNQNYPSCICSDGYELRNGRCIKLDTCDEVTCSDHGSCSVATGRVRCNCDEGFYADEKECLPDPCYEVTCGGHGVCSHTGNNAQCNCEDGFESNGLNCIPIDPCNGVTCSDHGVCNNNNGVAECVCNHGYSSQELSCIENISQSLRIELTWDKAGDLDLHLRKPGADNSAWGSNGDCFYQDCSDWYNEAAYNPVFVISDAEGTGPEIINIDKITPSTEPFTIAVHNHSNENRPTATVKIYCNDELNSQFTTVIPNFGSQEKSFWKVSNLVLTPQNFCETSPLGLGDYPGED